MRYARVQPQQWIYDEATDCDPSFLIDVTDAMEGIDPNDVKDDDTFLDGLWDRRMPDGNEHHGPYYVEIDL